MRNFRTGTGGRLLVIALVFALALPAVTTGALAQEDSTISTPTEDEASSSGDGVAADSDLNIGVVCAKYNDAGQRVFPGDDGYQDAEYRDGIYFIQRIIIAFIGMAVVGGFVRVMYLSVMSVISSGDGSNSYSKQRRNTLIGIGMVVGLPSMLKIVFDYILNQNVICFIPDVLN